MVNIVILDAKRKDAKTLAEFRYKMLFDIHPEREFGTSKEEWIKKTTEYYLLYMEDADQYSCLLQINKSIVGCGSIVFNHKPPDYTLFNRVFAYILNIYVEKEYRGNGFSKLIMKRLHEQAEKHGVYKIGLHASEQGKLVYQSLGYRYVDNYMELDLKKD